MIGLGEKGNWGVKVEPGDLILFSRRCSSMDMLSASICYGAKYTTMSEWDHVGIVTRNSDGILDIVEANIGGITRRPLDKRLVRTRAKKIAIRKIYGPKIENFDKKLDEMIEKYVDKGYNSSFVDMTRAWFNSYSYMYYGCNSYNSLISSKEHDLSHLENELKLHKQTHSPLFHYLINLRKSQLEEEIRELHENYREPCTPVSSSSASSSSLDTEFDKYFCSQLISSIYADMGLIIPQRSQHSHVPSEYSSSASSSGIRLISPFHFSPDIVFRSREMKFTSSNNSDLWIITKPEIPLKDKPLQFLFSEGDTLTIGSLPTFDLTKKAAPFDLHVGFDVLKGRFHFQNTLNSSPNQGQGSVLSVKTPPVMTQLPFSDPNLSQNRPLLTVKATTGTDAWSEIDVTFVSNKSLPQSQSQNQTQTHSKINPSLPNSKIDELSSVHLKTAQLFLASLPLFSSTISLEELVQHSRVVRHGKGTVLTNKDHPNHPIWFVCGGQIAGQLFDIPLNSSIPVSATAGSVLNCEGLLGSPSLLEWKVVTDNAYLLEIDRDFLVQKGLAASSWLWHCVTDQLISQQESHRIHIPSSFTRPRDNDNDNDNNEEEEEDKDRNKIGETKVQSLVHRLPPSLLPTFQGTIFDLVNCLLKEVYSSPQFVSGHSTIPLFSCGAPSSRRLLEHWSDLSS